MEQNKLIKVYKTGIEHKEFWSMFEINKKGYFCNFCKSIDGVFCFREHWTKIYKLVMNNVV